MQMIQEEPAVAECTPRRSASVRKHWDSEKIRKSLVNKMEQRDIKGKIEFAFPTSPFDGISEMSRSQSEEEELKDIIQSWSEESNVPEETGKYNWLTRSKTSTEYSAESINSILKKTRIELSKKEI